MVEIFEGVVKNNRKNAKNRLKPTLINSYNKKDDIKNKKKNQ